MNYRVEQHRQTDRGWTTITKVVTEEELKELGFFPLDPFDQKQFDECGRVVITGDMKYTVIERL